MKALGKLIVIDSGSDGSGKQTQTERLFERLVREGYNVRKVDFPNYKSPSSSLVTMYLNGDFGKDASAVNPYTASTFYSVDRFASYLSDWKSFYESGGIVLADRYTTSNMIHQAGKIDDPTERQQYLDWLTDLEFVKGGLPVPDIVLFLNVPVDVTIQLMKDRKNKINGSESKDIHESDEIYLRKCYNNACDIAKEYNWKNVLCTNEGIMRSIESIHEEIYETVKCNVLNLTKTRV